MKRITLVLMASVLAMIPYHAAIGKGQDAQINVTAQPLTLDTWTARTGHQLSSKLVYPDTENGIREGVVAVKFMCSDTGAPAGIALLKSSGSRVLDRAAMRGVARIKTLHPLPAGLAPSQKYVATVLFAKDQQSYTRQIRKLEQAQHDSNQWFNGGNQTLALGVGLLNEDVATLN